MTEVITSSVFNIEHLNKVTEDGRPIIKLPNSGDTRVLKLNKEDLIVSEPATPEKIEEKLKLYGGCIVRNYLLEEDCDQILKDVSPRLNSFSNSGDASNFISPTTRRASGTCLRSRTAAEKMLIHPLNLAVSNRFLGKENVFRIGEEAVTGFSKAQHNSCITFSIGPGSKDQPLHRDDYLHHSVRPYREKYTFGTETAVGTAVALRRTTKANGATRFIPGSHLWDHYRRPNEEDVFYAELEKGDCFFMLASCYHGGSANTTKDEQRIVTFLFMTQGTLRQEENIFLGTPIEYFKSLSIPALAALGLQTSQPFCGWHENEDPIRFLLPEADYEFTQFKDVYMVED
ncbi:unnamed protein product [Kuraishia capsulata CBS 1993]|uniref:Uncharacterized protein n=1 Tax=Kuraishia capsulata CBS 1993 TaxID=1382522 RepID=W6MUS8_9ASCO|nr:uncharacterized protein KUCA_T00005496001 [Kuraishia capsulata CBS 1993]CDK29507.1 unnamed protein product [Kuraishia capsulata CBS 1993]